MEAAAVEAAASVRAGAQLRQRLTTWPGCRWWWCGRHCGSDLLAAALGKAGVTGAVAAATTNSPAKKESARQPAGARRAPLLTWQRRRSASCRRRPPPPVATLWTRTSDGTTRAMADQRQSGMAWARALSAATSSGRESERRQPKTRLHGETRMPSLGSITTTFRTGTRCCMCWARQGSCGERLFILDFF